MINCETIQDRRLLLSQKLFKEFDGYVRYGPLKNYKLPKKAIWSQRDAGAKLLGLYEKDLMPFILNAAKTKSHLIDLGAADGYYAVGLLQAALFKGAIAFEISSKSRTVLSQSAIENNVSEILQIQGVASLEALSKIPEKTISDSLILIDIEGGEFEILDDSFFSLTREAVIIVEIHEWMVSEGTKRLENILSIARNTHSSTIINTGTRDLSTMRELKNYSDNDRWLIASEGRARAMQWICFEPIQQYRQ